MHFFSFLTSTHNVPNYDSKTEVYVTYQIEFCILFYTSKVILIKQK